MTSDRDLDSIQQQRLVDYLELIFGGQQATGSGLDPSLNDAVRSL